MQLIIGADMIELWNYYRSGTSHRVRIALNLKQIAWQYKELNLLKQDHKAEQYLAINPQGLAPAMIVQGKTLTQSPAMLEYIEERWPTPPLLPTDLTERAKVRAMAMLISCDIHPLNNLRVLNEVKSLTKDDTLPVDWIHKWISLGLTALESTLVKDKQRDLNYCFGDAPGLAECYLIPQVYSAKRFNMDMSAFPAINRIDKTCASLQAFIDAHPDNQPDAPKS